MKIRSNKTLSIALTLLVSATLSNARGQDAATLVGQPVMIVSWDAELKVGSDIVGQPDFGSIFEVSRVNGDWLWHKQAKGWIKRDFTVPLDKAIDHFTAKINSAPSSRTYHERGLASLALNNEQQALADFGAALQLDANNIAVYNDRGNLLRQTGDFDRSIADFTSVIGRNQANPVIYTNRGLAWIAKKEFDRAISDFNAAIQLDAKFAPAFESRGSAQQGKGNFAAAIADFRQAIELDDEFPRAHNNLAWLMATCPDAQFRNGAEAIKHAQQACELTEMSDPGYLDTLAAAYAEAGQFDEAVKTAKLALERADEPQKPSLQQHLNQFEAKKPIRG